MRPVTELLVRGALLAFVWLIWWWVSKMRLSNITNLSVTVGGVLLVFPLVWLGRIILDRRCTVSRAVWTTTFVHFA